MENPLANIPVQLQSAKVIVWYGCIPAGPVTCTVNGKRYERLLRNQAIPACIRIANLSESKARDRQHINKVTPETLRSVVEHAVCRFQLVAENGGEHIDHVLCMSCDN
ncbi:hypothetical protein CDAR_430301 [Caerostris darwini]|uniref:Uncharacterized protein n=1 Tax=Caerostris darwini TaxID=1538125 RepID=A0AAV4TZH9_9ARAC|nr:hypothetical protein CDAR_430301 [Caerostris darwini]